MTDPSKGLGALNDAERNLVRQCLNAAVAGPFFPDWEFRTLFGIERRDVAEVLERWPDLDDARQVDALAINNSLNNLWGYPHRLEDHWSEFIDAPRNEVLRVFMKWRGD